MPLKYHCALQPPDARVFQALGRRVSLVLYSRLTHRLLQAIIKDIGCEKIPKLMTFVTIYLAQS
jgi:hypothetical protein